MSKRSSICINVVHVDDEHLIIRTRSVTFGAGGGSTRRVGRWGYKTAVKRICWCRITKVGSLGGMGGGGCQSVESAVSNDT